ncbi:MAG: hypothetical protein V3U93_09215 [Alphaproteobacteria bacterium]
MKGKRELSIAMVLVGLVGANFFYLADIFFSGLERALFRSGTQVLIGWNSATLVILSNVVALVGLFYLVRPQPGVATESGLTQEGPTEGASTEAGPTQAEPTEGVSTEDRPSEDRPSEGGPSEGGPTERQGN